MKITCKQQDMSRGLSVVSHAVSSRSTLPILANILLTTDQGRLKLSATNLEIGINAWIDAEIIEEGSTTVPAKTMSDLVGSLRPGNVELSVSDESHTMNIKGAGTNATLKGMDPSEFPLIPGVEDGDEPITFDVARLKEAIRYVAFSAADDDARPVLTGVRVEMDGKNETVTFAAADAFRLAVMVDKIVLPKNIIESNLLIPARTLSELVRILPDEGTVQMTVGHQVLFHTGNVDMVSRLIEGTFPNFRGIIPREHSTRCVVDVKEFAAAVKTVTPFARDSSNIARIKLSGGVGVDEGSLTIEANAEDIGSNVSTINASVDGPEQEIIFNVRYLSDVLGVITTPEVALEIVSSGKPGVIHPVGGGDYTYIIMPMSVNK